MRETRRRDTDAYLDRTADRLRTMSAHYTDVYEADADEVEHRLRTMAYGSPRVITSGLRETS